MAVPVQVRQDTVLHKTPVPEFLAKAIEGDTAITAVAAGEEGLAMKGIALQATRVAQAVVVFLIRAALGGHIPMQAGMLAVAAVAPETPAAVAVVAEEDMALAMVATELPPAFNILEAVAANGVILEEDLVMWF
jgi:hypothetical protein